MVFVNGVKGENKVYIKREEALRQIFLEAMGHDFDFNAEYRNIYKCKTGYKKYSRRGCGESAVWTSYSA